MKNLAALLALFCAPPATADFDAASYPPYETCALCHGLFGQSHTDKFPHLAGQKPGYIRAQLDAFLAGERSNDGGQMVSIVTELKPEDLPVVVKWFSEQDPPPPSQAPPNDAGMIMTAEAGCLDCHGTDGADDVPYLSAQHAGYLTKQMRDFRDGKRTHSPVAGDHHQMLQKTDNVLDQIAAYLSSVERKE